MNMKKECSRNCVQGGDWVYSPFECNTDTRRKKDLLWRRRRASFMFIAIRKNRSYDGSRCFCKPCIKCHAVWKPTDTRHCDDPGSSEWCGRYSYYTACLFDSDEKKDADVIMQADLMQSCCLCDDCRDYKSSILFPNDSTVDLDAFLRRNARAHWKLVRDLIRVRPFAFHWMETYVSRINAPESLNMVDELESAMGFGTTGEVQW